MSDRPPSAHVSALEARMRDLQIRLLATKSSNTLRAYDSDLRDYRRFCQGHGMVEVPAAPLTIAKYMVELVERGNKLSTILRRHASISMADQLAGLLGRELEIPRGERPDTCPVRALRAWYSVSGIRNGPLFRPVDRYGRMAATRLTDRGIAPVIKRSAQRAGLDPTRYAVTRSVPAS